MIPLFENKTCSLRYTKICTGTFQIVFGPSLALYGSVWNSEAGVLHGFSARIFCLFMPRGKFWSPGLDFGSPGRHFGPDLFGGEQWDPKKVVLRRNHFVMAVQGISRDPNEFYYI